MTCSRLLPPIAKPHTREALERRGFGIGNIVTSCVLQHLNTCLNMSRREREASINIEWMLRNIAIPQSYIAHVSGGYVKSS